MIHIFIGYDAHEKEAFYTLAHSIHTRSSIPVAITPVHYNSLPGIYRRPRQEHDSTDFSNARFMVPYLSGYSGWSLFMDCDFLCLDDIAKLWAYRDDSKAIQVVKHQHQPSENTKFLNQEQSSYSRKNWSSLMLFNNARCRSLDVESINTLPGLHLHRFKWVSSDLIGELPAQWNVLVDSHSEPYGIPQDLKPSMLHWTKGGPWFPEFYDCSYADLWRTARYEAMTNE